MKRLLFAVAAVVAVASSPAQAAPSCKNLSVTPLAFGNYNLFSGTPNDSAGTISYSCPPPTTPTVTIDLGLAFANGRRRMTRTAGGDWLSYDVFLDPARTVVWSSTPVDVPAGNGSSVPFYGRVFAQQDVAQGNYSDTLVVTFTF